MSNQENLRETIKNMPVGFHGKYSTHIDGERHTWFIQSLVRAAEHLPVVKTKLTEVDVNLDENVWFYPGHEPTVRAIMNHYRRIEKADLSYPIIFSKEFGLMDGYHRLMKAHVTGRTTIDAIYFDKLPKPDYIGVF